MIQSRLKIAAPCKLCRTKALCLGKKIARKGKGNGGGAFSFPYSARPKACSQANGFALQVRKTNQLGRLMISQRTFQPGKRYGFFCCGFRLFFVKEEIRQLPRGRIPYYMNHKGKTHPKKRQLRSVSVSVFKSVIISPRVRLNGALILFCKCSYLSLSIASR